MNKIAVLENPTCVALLVLVGYSWNYCDSVNKKLSIIILGFVTIMCGWVQWLLKVQESRIKMEKSKSINLIRIVAEVLFVSSASFSAGMRWKYGLLLPKNDNDSFKEQSTNLIFMLLLPLTLYFAVPDIKPTVFFFSWAVICCFIYSVNTVHDARMFTIQYTFIISLIFFKITTKSSESITKSPPTDTIPLPPSQEATESRCLIANIAHDLKSPLTSFISGIEMLSSIVQEMDRSLLHRSSNHHPTGHEMNNKEGDVGDLLTHVEDLKGTILDLKHVNLMMLMTINRCVDYAKISQGMPLIPQLEAVSLLTALNIPMDCVLNMQSKVNVRFMHDIFSHDRGETEVEGGEEVEGKGVGLPSLERMQSIVIQTDKQWLVDNLLCLMTNALKFTTESPSSNATTTSTTNDTTSPSSSASNVITIRLATCLRNATDGTFTSHRIAIPEGNSKQRKESMSLVSQSVDHNKVWQHLYYDGSVIETPIGKTTPDTGSYVKRSLRSALSNESLSVSSSEGSSTGQERGIGKEREVSSERGDGGGGGESEGSANTPLRFDIDQVEEVSVQKKQLQRRIDYLLERSNSPGLFNKFYQSSASSAEYSRPCTLSNESPLEKSDLCSDESSNGISNLTSESRKHETVEGRRNDGVDRHSPLTSDNDSSDSKQKPQRDHPLTGSHTETETEVTVHLNELKLPSPVDPSSSESQPSSSSITSNATAEQPLLLDRDGPMTSSMNRDSHPLTLPEDLFLRIEVEDSGIGVPLSIRESLFQSTHQSHRQVGGTGFGLLCLHQRVKALGGYCGIADRNDDQAGCVVWFAIPVWPKDPSLSEPYLTEPTQFPTIHEDGEANPSHDTSMESVDITQTSSELTADTVHEVSNPSDNSSLVEKNDHSKEEPVQSIHPTLSMDNTPRPHPVRTSSWLPPLSTRLASGRSLHSSSTPSMMHQDSFHYSDSNTTLLKSRCSRSSSSTTPRFGHHELEKGLSISCVPSLDDTLLSSHAYVNLGSLPLHLVLPPMPLLKVPALALSIDEDCSGSGTASKTISESRSQKRETATPSNSSVVKEDLSVSSSRASTLSPSPLPTLHRKLNILLVDDSMSIMKISTSMLRRHGHVVDTAENGAIAVEKFFYNLRPPDPDEVRMHEADLYPDPMSIVSGKDSIPYDVILMDLQMPVMDGFEATKNIRVLEINGIQSSSKGLHPQGKSQFDGGGTESKTSTTSSDTDSRQTPRPVQHRPRQIIIGVSANSDHVSISQAFDAGIDGFMGKPFTLAKFYETFDRLSKSIHTFN